MSLVEEVRSLIHDAEGDIHWAVEYGRSYDGQALVADIVKLITARCAEVAKQETGIYPHGNMMYGPAAVGRVVAAILKLSEG